MLDINVIRENPEKVKEALKKKLWDTDFTELLQWDKQRKELIQEVEGNKAEMNQLSASVPAAKKAGEDVSKIFAKVKEIAAKNQQKDQELKELEAKIFNFLKIFHLWRTKYPPFRFSNFLRLRGPFLFAK